MSLGRENLGIPLDKDFNGKKKIIIEDAHVNLLNVLGEVDKMLNKNDYLIIEDSAKKQQCISEFMRISKNNYSADQFFLDFFGMNSTCCIDSIFKVV